MGTLVQRNNGRAWIEVGESSGNTTLAPYIAYELDLEPGGNSDWQLHFPVRDHTLRLAKKASRVQAEESNAARTQWLEEHDVHTEFLDAGTGCCWFAQQGDQEPVSGETEDEAIARLARENGLPWCPLEHS
jgi:hypothetical protein